MKTLVRRSSMMVLVIVSLIISGCGKKAQENQNQPVDSAKVTKPVDTAAVKETNKEKAVDTTAAKVEKKKEAEKPAAQETLKGTWSGKFEGHNATLSITSVNGNNFGGSMTIHYREVISQKVAGTFNPAKLSVSMKDQLHSKQMGTYSAKVSKDMKSMSGTFTTNLDKQQVSFSLTKTK